jgi:hypothetical protein
MQDLWGRSHRLRSQLAFPYCSYVSCLLEEKTLQLEDSESLSPAGSATAVWISRWIIWSYWAQVVCERMEHAAPIAHVAVGKWILVWCTIENGRLMKISENTSHPACCNSGQWRLGTVNGSCWWFTVANWGDVQKSCSECTCWGCAYSSPKTLSKHTFMSDNIQQDLRVSKRWVIPSLSLTLSPFRWFSIGLASNGEQVAQPSEQVAIFLLASWPVTSSRCSQAPTWSFSLGRWNTTR